MNTPRQHLLNKQAIYMIIALLSLLTGSVSWILGIFHVLPQVASEIVAMVFAVVSVWIPVWQMLPQRKNTLGTIVVYTDEHLRGHSVSLYNNFLTPFAIIAYPMVAKSAVPIIERVIDGHYVNIAVFHPLPSGSYTVYLQNSTSVYCTQITLLSGQILEVDWQR